MTPTFVVLLLMISVSFQQLFASAEVLKVKNHVLVGFASEVLTKEGLNDCIIACENNLIGPNRSDPCRSGMFFETKKGNCILNSVTKEEHPDLFVEGTERGSVTYFQINSEEN